MTSLMGRLAQIDAELIKLRAMIHNEEPIFLDRLKRLEDFVFGDDLALGVEDNVIPDNLEKVQEQSNQTTCYVIRITTENKKVNKKDRVLYWRWKENHHFPGQRPGIFKKWTSSLRECAQRFISKAEAQEKLEVLTGRGFRDCKKQGYVAEVVEYKPRKEEKPE